MGVVGDTRYVVQGHHVVIGYRGVGLPYHGVLNSEDVYYHLRADPCRRVDLVGRVGEEYESPHIHVNGSTHELGLGHVDDVGLRQVAIEGIEGVGRNLRGDLVDADQHQVAVVVPVVVLHCWQRVTVLALGKVEGRVELLGEGLAREIEEALSIIATFNRRGLANRTELIVRTIEVAVDGE